MKRTLGITLSALALVLASSAFADDAPATPAATTPAPATTDAAATPVAAKTMHHKAAKHTLVDLNSASKEDLAKLPGVGDDGADKIIAARPFKTRGELLSKKIVSRSQYKKIRSWVSAK